jgi:hypothetical protein
VDAEAQTQLVGVKVGSLEAVAQAPAQRNASTWLLALVFD